MKNKKMKLADLTVRSFVLDIEESSEKLVGGVAHTGCLSGCGAPHCGPLNQDFTPLTGVTAC